MRIRTVKPEALKDEELWDLEAETGLPLYRAFQGLWMGADREGRFQWRPRMLKSEILPYWTGDFETVLDALAGAGFIVRYTVDGRVYGHVPTLGEHQRFDHREPPSTLPPPPPLDPEDACEAPPGHAPTLPGHARVEGKGREGKGTGREGEARPGAPEPPLPEVHGLVIVARPVVHPPQLGPSRRELAEVTALGTRPAPKFDFAPGWEPSEDHRARGHELGLTDEEILAEAEDCARKTYERPIKSEDDQFYRELGWLAADKKKNKHKLSNHERRQFENPGGERARDSGPRDGHHARPAREPGGGRRADLLLALQSARSVDAQPGVQGVPRRAARADGARSGDRCPRAPGDAPVAGSRADHDRGEPARPGRGERPAPARARAPERDARPARGLDECLRRAFRGGSPTGASLGGAQVQARGRGGVR